MSGDPRGESTEHEGRGKVQKVEDAGKRKVEGGTRTARTQHPMATMACKGKIRLTVL